MALTLVSAVYNFDSGYLDLQFDRAVNVDGYLPLRIQVYDGVYAQQFRLVVAVALVSPAVVRCLEFETFGEFLEPHVMLYAQMTTGIVAVDDGGTWIGVPQGVELPYP